MHLEESWNVVEEIRFEWFELGFFNHILAEHFDIIISLP